MFSVLLAERTEFTKLKTIRIVTTILLGHVITVLTFLAGHSYFWPHIVSRHFYLLVFLEGVSMPLPQLYLVARAGIEPATQRL
ncbi:MAG: hypothetical protein RL587_803 [Actinomycetota bacterium]